MEFRASEGDLAALLESPGPVLEAAIATLSNEPGGRRVLCENAIDVALSWRVRGAPLPDSVAAPIGVALEDVLDGSPDRPYADVLAGLGVRVPSVERGTPPRGNAPSWLCGRARVAGVELAGVGDPEALAQRACADMFLCEFVDATRALAAIGERGAATSAHLLRFLDDARRYLRSLAAELRSPTLSWEIAILDAAPE